MFYGASLRHVGSESKWEFPLAVPELDDIRASLWLRTCCFIQPLDLQVTEVIIISVGRLPYSTLSKGPVTIMIHDLLLQESLDQIIEILNQ